MAGPASTNDTSSTDLVLRCYAPQVVARAHARAQTGVGDFRDTLGWRLGFIEVTHRFLLSVLAPLHVGLGLPAGKEFQVLLKQKLATPSLGDVAHVVDELAQALVTRPIDAWLMPLVQLVAKVDDATGKPVKTDFSRRLRSLIDRRNTLFHNNPPMPHEEMAKQVLTEEAETFQALMKELRILKHTPLLYVTSREKRQDGSVRYKYLRLTGQSPIQWEETFQDKSIDLPDRVPMLLLSNGDLLLLQPYLVVAKNQASGLTESRVLYGWDSKAKRLTYSLMDGGGHAPLVTDPREGMTSPEELLSIAPGEHLWKGSLPPEVAARIQGKNDFGGLPLIDGFDVLELIGAGASSNVYLGQQHLNGKPPRRVAIKVLTASVAEDPMQRARLEREHELLAGLVHTSIVKVFKYLPDDGPSLVLEFVEGEDLHSLTERKLQPRERVVQYIEQVLEALSAVHAKKIFHRDVKPSNILVGKDRVARLIDFGIATVERMPVLTRTMDSLGSAGFAAPEQTKGEKLTAATDIYAVGRVLEFALTRTLGSTLEGVPPGLQAIIRKATQAEVPCRYQSALEMLDALAARKTADWQGAPVDAGDRLSESFEVVIASVNHDDLYSFRGREVATGADVAIIVAARTPTASERLLGAVKGLPRAQRPRCLRTLDGLQYAVMGMEDPARALERLLGLEAARPSPSSAPTSERSISHRSRTGAAPWIDELSAGWDTFQELLEDPMTVPDAASTLRVIGFVELVMTVLAIQAEVLRTDRIDPAFLNELLGIGTLLRRVRGLSELRAMSSPDLNALEVLRDIRNAHAHGFSQSDLHALPNGLFQRVESLIDVAHSQSTRLRDRERLRPVIARVGSKRKWAVLRRMGSRAEYAFLGAPGTHHELTEDAANWLAVSDEQVTNPRVNEERRTIQENLERKVQGELATFPFSGQVERDATGTHGGRSRRTDFLLRTKSGAPLAVVECKPRVEGPLFGGMLDQVWLASLAHQAPFAAVTDGMTWRWFRIDQDAGPLELRGTDEVAHAAEGRTIEPLGPPAGRVKRTARPQPRLTASAGSVLVHPDGERVLLRRPANASGTSLQWTHAKGHIRADETPERAALRKAEVELGVSCTICSEIPGWFEGRSTSTRYFVARWQSDSSSGPDPRETAEVRWLTWQEAFALLAEGPESDTAARDQVVLSEARAAVKR